MGAYEDFVAFVHERIFELRGEAHKVTGDDRLADQLLVRALARLAGRWPSTKDESFDAEQYAYDAMARETGAVLRDADGDRGGDVRIDGAEYEAGVHRTATPLAVADAAWQLSAKLRGRRWRRVVAVAAAVAVIYAGYYVSVHNRPADTPPPDALPDNPNQVATLLNGVDLMPNSYALSRATPWTRDHPAIPSLPAEIPLPADAPKLSEHAPDRITAAIQAGSGEPVYVLDGGGRPYLVDAYTPSPYANNYFNGSLARRSVSPDGKRVALVSNAGVDVVGIGESTHHYDVDPGKGEVVDIAWYVDDTALLVTQATGTSLVDVATGTSVPQPFSGVDAVIPASWSQPLHTMTPGPLATDRSFLDVTTWKLASPGAAATWVASDHVAVGQTWLSQWGAHGQANGDLLAKDCQPKDAVFKMPNGYGRAVDCVAIIDPAAKSLKRALIRDSSHQTGPRAGLLGWLDDTTLLLATEDNANGHTLVVAWNWSTGVLHLVSTVGRNAMVALAGGGGKG